MQTTKIILAAVEGTGCEPILVTLTRPNSVDAIFLIKDIRLPLEKVAMKASIGPDRTFKHNIRFVELLLVIYSIYKLQ
jgi:hypothetical protein